MKTEGKIVVKGCRTPQDEERHDKTRAQKSAIEHAKYEKKVKHVLIKTDSKTVLSIPEEKYNANKQHYDSINLLKRIN